MKRGRTGIRLAAGIAGGVLLVLAGAIVAVPPYLLRSRRLLSIVNEDPDKLRIEYSGARSPWPGRIAVDGLEVRGSDPNVQWWFRMEHAEIRYSLVDLGIGADGHVVVLAGLRRYAFDVARERYGPGLVEALVALTRNGHRRRLCRGNSGERQQEDDGLDDDSNPRFHCVPQHDALAVLVAPPCIVAFPWCVPHDHTGTLIAVLEGFLRSWYRVFRYCVRRRARWSTSY